MYDTVYLLKLFVDFSAWFFTIFVGQGMQI